MIKEQDARLAFGAPTGLVAGWIGGISRVCRGVASGREGYCCVGGGREGLSTGVYAAAATPDRDLRRGVCSTSGTYTSGCGGTSANSAGRFS